MEQINIIFFAILSFFNVENGRIAATKTTVTVDTSRKTVLIEQENLFSIIKNESEDNVVVDQWNHFITMMDNDIIWSEDLKSFTDKKVIVDTVEEGILPKITLSYSHTDDLRDLGIWFNELKNDYSINNVPVQNLKTSDGVLHGNYWVFEGDQVFSFTLEPFLDLPEGYQSFVKPLEEILSEAKK
ncbi:MULTISPECIES: hypothetical protein [Nonlabens]|uniref:hypothetical protein n=1 Tax=Nonlabens TaxID=363408 RepID=UPI0037C57040